MNIVDLEERLDQLLARPRVKDLAAAHKAATAWSDAVWSSAESAGPPVLAANEIEQAFAVVDRPVFVFGAHRSGTTLARDLLDQHPALCVLPAEGTMFTNFEQHLARLGPDDWLRFLGCEWLRRLANPINQQPYWLLGRSSGKRSPYVDFARALMAWWPVVRARHGRRITSWPLVAIVLAYGYCTTGFMAVRRWVEKTPANERFLSRLTTEFPEAKLIHLVRDPCAVYASHRRSAQVHGHSLDEGRILQQMRLSYQEAARRSVLPASGSYLLLRYEDLVEDTAGSVKRMAEFLGIQPLPVMMQPTANGIPTPSNSSFGADELAGRLNRRPPGDVFGVLTQDDRERLSAMMSDTAGKLGYRLVPLPALRRRLLRMLIQAQWVADRLKARWTRFISPWLSAAAILLACLSPPLHAQSSNFSGEVALASQLVDRGLAITPATPVLQGSVSWALPEGWSLGLAGGVEARSPGHLVVALARVSHSWALSSDWQAQASLLYYDYRAGRGADIPDRADANLYFTYRDTLTFGLSAIRVSGDRDRRLLGTADLDLSWPLTRHVSLSAGAGIAQAAVASHDPGWYHHYDYRNDPIRLYGYGHLGLAWSDGPWHLQVDRNLDSLGERRVYGAQASSNWVATLSWSF